MLTIMDGPTELISLNFRGTLVQFKRSLLLKIPNNSGFNKYLEENYSVSLIELQQHKENRNIFINRSVYLFHNVLDYMENRELHFPHCVCLSVIEKELQFWGITTCQLASCCLDRLFLEQEEKLKKDTIEKAWHNISRSEEIVHLSINDINGSSSSSANKNTCKTAINNGKIHNIDDKDNLKASYTQRKSDKIRHILNDPESCIMGKIWAAVVIFIIIFSILLLSLETEPRLRNPPLRDVMQETNLTKGQGLYIYYSNNSKPCLWILILDCVLTFILTADFIARLILSKKKLLFLKLPITILDILGILPVWILFIIYIHATTTLTHDQFHTTALKYAYYFALLRILRIFRLGHIILHNKKLRIVALALMCSWQEMLVLFTLVTVIALLFGILMYYIAIWQEDTFLTVFQAQWWALITMATVGYGDFYPKSAAGRSVGVLCCLCGIVTVAMSTSIFVNNFLYIYKCVEKFDRMYRIKLFKEKGSASKTSLSHCI